MSRSDLERAAAEKYPQRVIPYSGDTWEDVTYTLGPAPLAERAAYIQGRLDGEAAQRPTVSPEVREALIAYLSSDLSDVDDLREGYLDKSDATWIVDALLSRFALPELDPEKVAELLATHDWDAEREACTCRERGWSFEHVADMLIAALPTLTKNGDV